jgi:cytoskeletal protein CcmA (bactofilin family)
MTDRPSDHGPKRRFTDERSSFATIIGRDLRIEGRFDGAADLEIWGSFEGEMTIEGLVWMHPGSRFAGELATTDLVIEGELRGTVRATGKVDMRSTCRVEGDVTATKVAAAEGSHIEGRITVTGGTDEVTAYPERRER